MTKPSHSFIISTYLPSICTLFLFFTFSGFNITIIFLFIDHFSFIYYIIIIFSILHLHLLQCLPQLFFVRNTTKWTIYYQLQHLIS